MNKPSVMMHGNMEVESARLSGQLDGPEVKLEPGVAADTRHPSERRNVKERAIQWNYVKAGDGSSLAGSATASSRDVKSEDKVCRMTREFIFLKEEPSDEERGAPSEERTAEGEPRRSEGLKQEAADLEFVSVGVKTEPKEEKAVCGTNPDPLGGESYTTYVTERPLAKKKEFISNKEALPSTQEVLPSEKRALPCEKEDVPSNRKINIVMQHCQVCQKEFLVAASHKHMNYCPSCEETCVHSTSNTTQDTTTEETSLKATHSCSLCKQTVTSSEGLHSHTERECDHHLARSLCLNCDGVFSHRCKLNAHIKHTLGHPKPLMCPTCNETFSQREEVVTHVMHCGHKEALTCPKCTKKIVHKEQMISHMEDCYDNETQVCLSCRKMFLQREDLLAHVDNCTHRRKYICSTCSRTFLHKQDFTFHTKDCLHKTANDFHTETK